MPGDRSDVVIKALAGFPDSSAVPITVAPSMKFTLPEGTPASVHVTVAVNATDWPNMADLWGEEIRVFVSGTSA